MNNPLRVCHIEILEPDEVRFNLPADMDQDACHEQSVMVQFLAVAVKLLPTATMVLLMFGDEPGHALKKLDGDDGWLILSVTGEHGPTVH